jgi:hypothetical protein
MSARWLAATLQANRVLLEGRFADAEALVESARALCSTRSSESDGVQHLSAIHQRVFRLQ